MSSTAATRLHRDCPSCGAPSSQAAPVAFGVAEWPMVRCAKCDLIYLEWVPVYSALYDELAWTAQHKKEEQRRLDTQPILARIDLATRWRLGILGDATPAGGLLPARPKSAGMNAPRSPTTLTSPGASSPAALRR